MDGPPSRSEVNFVVEVVTYLLLVLVQYSTVLCTTIALLCEIYKQKLDELMTSIERKVINIQVFIAADGMATSCMPICIVIINNLYMRRETNVVTI